jgi:hypothetical protein
VDNLFSEKQRRLLTEPLYASWQPAEQRAFAVFANVGLFYALREPALVPDAMLSMDISLRNKRLNLLQLKSEFLLYKRV